MRLRRFSTVALCLVISPVAAFADKVETMTALSWNSAAQPILNVLALNEGEASRTLNVVAPEAIRCNGEKIKSVPKQYRRFLDITNWHSPSTDGVVRAGSWLHRSFPLGLEAPLEGSCEATFRVTDKESGETIESGRIDIPLEPPKREVSDLKNPAVSAEMLIEEDRDYPELLVVRVLARNNGQKGLVLYEEGRNVQCSDGCRIEWPMNGGVLQGEDSGPIWIGPGEWAAFVNVARFKRSSEAKPCTIDLRLSALHESGSRQEVARISGPLMPSGYISRPWRHRR